MVIKKALKIFWLTLVSIVSVIFAVSLTIQIPQVQTFIASKVINNISEKIEGDISFEKIHFKPFTTIVIKNVVITDRNPVKDSLTGVQVDTFFRSQYIIAKFTLEGIFANNSLHLDKAYIGNAQMNLVLEDKPDLGDGDTTSENLTRIFGIKKKEVKEFNDNEIFHIRKVEVNNMGFHMFNHKKEKIKYEGGINWNDLDVSNIKMDASELQFKGGIMYGNLDQLTFKEKSGWECRSISGSAKVGRGKAIIEDIRLKDKWSDIHLPLYMMSFSHPKDFSDYIGKIKMDGEIASSTLDFRTLQYFAPQLGDNRLKAEVSGSMSGYVNDFTVKNVSIASYAGGFAGKVDGRITGLPEIEKTRIDARLSNCQITADGLGTFISEWSDGEDMDFSSFAKGILFSVNGRAKGLIDHLNTNIAVSSLTGKVNAALRLDNIISPRRPFGISGRVSTDNLDAGMLIGTELIRQVSLQTGFKAKIGRGLDFPEVDLDSLVVDRLHFNGYDYNNIAAYGEITGKSFRGKVLSTDPYLDFLFQGEAALAPSDGELVYDFSAEINHADLFALNIDKRDRSEISLKTDANFIGYKDGEANGYLNVTDITLSNSSGTYNVGNVEIKSHDEDKDHLLELNSGFAKARYTGTAPILNFINDLQNISFKKEIPALFSNPEYEWEGNEYKAEIRFDNMINLLAYILPGLYIEAGTEIIADINNEGIFNGSINSGRVAFKKQYLKGISAQLTNSNSNLSGDIVCNEIQAASLKLCDNHMQIYANDNHIGFGYTYDNHSELENRGEFIIHGDLTRENDTLALGMDIMQSMLYLNSREWKILPSSMKIKGHDISVDSFCLNSNEEMIRIDGATSSTQKDSLTLELQRFDISIFNSIMPDLGLKGALSGTVRLTSPTRAMGLEIDMLCDSTRIADIPLGILDISSNWNKTKNILGLHLSNDLNGRTSLSMDGRLFTNSKILDADIRLDRMDVGYVQPLLKDIFSGMKGYISSDITIEGPFDNIEISSTGGKLEEGMLRIGYTNVPYYADGTFHIDSKGVYFDQMHIKDRFDGTGQVTGSINWDHFRDISFDTRIKVNQIEGINLTEDLSEYFYGSVFATGNIALTGPVSAITLDVDAVTAKRGQLHIPVTASGSTGQTNLLKFTEPEKEIYIDPYEAMMTDLQKKEAKQSDFNLNLRVNAQPTVEAFVEIDKASGNVLSGRGSGLLDLNVTNDDFLINGDYTLSGGNYKFVAMGLVSRDFQIQDGSSIRFNGDIMDSSLDIDAIYKTKASLSTLIADTTSVANRRTVECGISITDQISNPRLGFSIQIPDLDPTIKSRVESALSTEDKVQKQFLSLILSNSFLPDEQSGIVNNSSMLYSNVTEMLANQLSNIFHKLDIPLDLGLNYQPNEKGNDIFDVAVSTQLFNNRVVVNGSVGNKQYSSGGTQDVVGDLDIEIKIDRSGAFRLNLFSHSADSYTNYLDNSQRNGVGLTFQTEFNSFGKFFKYMFSSKAKRQAARRAEEQAMLEGGQTQIKIEAPQKKSKKK